jgi:hypothetical protein
MGIGSCSCSRSPWSRWEEREIAGETEERENDGSKWDWKGCLCIFLIYILCICVIETGLRAGNLRSAVNAGALRACLVPFPTQPGQLQAARLHSARLDGCKRGRLVECICGTRMGWDSVWLHACVSRFKYKIQGWVFGYLHTTSSRHLLHEVVALPPTTSHAHHISLHELPNEKTK